MVPVVAAFDVDGTLTVRDCVFPFLMRVGGLNGAVRALLGSPQTLVRLGAARDRDGLKAHFVRAFLAGQSLERVQEIGAEFAERIAHGWMRRDVAERLRWHQDNGHVVVLVSASLAPYLEPLGDLLEVDAVLCTNLTSVDGTLTGELDGKNCRGAEKVARLTSWGQAAGLTGTGWLEYAYGDSAGDAAMLSLATSGMNVSRIECSA